MSDRGKCPPIGSFPTSATDYAGRPCASNGVSADRFISDVSNNPQFSETGSGLSVRRSVHFRRQQRFAGWGNGIYDLVSADRFISDVSNFSNTSLVEKLKVSADRFISDVSNPRAQAGRRNRSRVRRSVHFRRQQPGW